MEEEISKLKASLDTAPEAEGVYRLKFMQKGVEKQRAAALEALEDADDSDEDGKGGGGGRGGRKSFGGGSGSSAAAAGEKLAITSFDAPGWGNEEGDAAERTAFELGVAKAAAATKSARVDGNITIPVGKGVRDQMAGPASAPAAEEKAAAPERRVTRSRHTGPLAAAAAKATSAGAGAGSGAGKRKGGSGEAGEDGEDGEAPVDVESAGAADDSGANPWLKTSSSNAGLTPSMAMTKFTRKADKRQAKLQRTARTTVSSEASDVLIDVDKANDVAAKGKGAGAQGKAAGKAKGKGKGGAASVGEIDENDADHVDEAVHSSEAFDMTANASAEQKKLIKAAFADDDVIEEEFAEEKAKLTDQQTIKDKDVTLPGWGVWGGHGVVNAKPQKYVAVRVESPRPLAARAVGLFAPPSCRGQPHPSSV